MPFVRYRFLNGSDYPADGNVKLALEDGAELWLKLAAPDNRSSMSEHFIENVVGIAAASNVVFHKEGGDETFELGARIDAQAGDKFQEMVLTVVTDTNAIAASVSELGDVRSNPVQTAV